MAALQTIYRPPVAGEPIRLREDGHWSTDGLVGYWPMREMHGGMTQDVSVFGNHGTLINGPTWVAGETGVALSFDGINDSISVPTQLPQLSGDSISICMRVRYDGGSSRMLCWQDWSGHSGNRFSLQIPFWSQPRQWRWTVCSSDTCATSYGPTPPTTGEWQHLCGTYDGAEVRLWIDGVSMEPAPLSGNINPANSPLYLFTRGTDYYFLGLADSVQFYNRALSAAEIRALYAAPDLPLWRPRRGISLAALAVPTGRPRPFTQHRHGPRLVIGGFS